LLSLGGAYSIRPIMYLTTIMTCTRTLIFLRAYDGTVANR